MLTTIFLIAVVLVCLSIAIYAIRLIPNPPPVPWLTSALIVLACVVAIVIILRLAGISL